MATTTPTRAALALLALLPGAAGALNLQFKPSAHVEVQREENVFRAPDAPPPGSAPRVDDTLTSYGAGARLTLRESLQEVEFRGEYDRVDYAELNQLDYGRYLFGGEARLAEGSTVRLRLDASRERRQETFAFRDDTDQSFIMVDQADAELRVAVTPKWTAVARGSRYATEASRVASQDYDTTETSAELGGEYRLSGYSYAGLGYRHSEGEFPRRVVTPGDGREKEYTQQSLVSRIGYTPSGLSDIQAQLAYTRRSHDDAAVPDFSGVTGRLGYTRRFSGISQLQVEAYRDLFYVEDINANYVENLGLRAALDYRLSAKLALALLAERYDSSYKGSPGFNVAGEARKDEVLGLRIGADYQPFYRFSIVPEYRYERRDSNLASNAYDFSVVGVDFSYEYGVRTRR